MLKVAITGNIASGKSTLEAILRKKGFEVLDTDFVSHNLLNENSVKSLIMEVFAGFDILENGIISRPKLGKIVFENENLRKNLERIIHPEIKIEIERFFCSLEEKGKKIAFVSVPLLFEANFQDIFDKIILVYADDDLRLERLMKRNDFTLERAKHRLDIQMSQEKKTALSDYILYNNGTLEDFFNQLVEQVTLNHLVVGSSPTKPKLKALPSGKAFNLGLVFGD
jgi:dephospho-CoA kinase